MVFELSEWDTTASMRAMWKVISFCTGMNTAAYYNWFCRFCEKHEIKKLSQLVYIEIADVQSCPIWNELPLEKQEIMARFLGRNSHGRPNFRYYAEAKLHEMCNYLMDHKSEQSCLMVEIEKQINIEISKLNAFGVCDPEYEMPDVQWLT